MKLERKSFQTKVARRIFILFIICALLPTSLLAGLSYIHIRNYLLEQGQKRLRQESKTVGLSIFERLGLLRAELSTVASAVRSSQPRTEASLPQALAREIEDRFLGLAIAPRDKGPLRRLLGAMKESPEITAPQEEHVLAGRALLHLGADGEAGPALFMSIALDPEDPGQGLLFGEINPAFLWQAAMGKPQASEVCVLDRSRRVLYSDIPESGGGWRRTLAQMPYEHAGQFPWIRGGQTHFAGYFSVFLESNFLAPEWIVILSRAKEEVLAPAAGFNRVFPFVVLLSLGLVFLLSLELIRRNTVPIEILREATMKIADGDFGHRVEIESGDEFEGLGAAFNEMRAKVEEGQQLLVRAAKLSAMGQMGAGIVHEIKQPLTALYGLIQVALMEKAPEKVGQRLEQMMEVVERLNQILTKFKSFAHMSGQRQERISLSQVIDRVHQLLEHQFMMKQIRCRVECQAPLPCVMGDGDALQQVCLNLLINAMDALEEKKDGPRTVYVKAYGQGEKVLVEVGDNGCGIPPEIRERMFDPFFTTKPADKGTGLGMAIIESILDKHQASIGVESEVGVGTKFTIVFPTPAEGPVAGDGAEPHPDVYSMVVPA